MVLFNKFYNKREDIMNITPKRKLKTKSTKTYKMLKERYEENVKVKKTSAFKYFMKIIVSSSQEGFLKKSKMLFLIIEESFLESALSQSEKNEIDVVFNKKLEEKLESVHIDFKDFFNKYNLYVEQIIFDVDKESTLAFIASPILYVSFLSDVLTLRYKDVELHNVAGSLILLYKDSKGTKKVVLNSQISDTYMKIFTALKEKYTEDEFIFVNTEKLTWDIAKTNKFLYSEYSAYITGDKVNFNTASFLTLLKNEFKMMSPLMYSTL